jgi:hypothetical protein
LNQLLEFRRRRRRKWSGIGREPFANAQMFVGTATIVSSGDRYRIATRLQQLVRDIPTPAPTNWRSTNIRLDSSCVVSPRNIKRSHRSDLKQGTSFLQVLTMVRREEAHCGHCVGGVTSIEIERRVSHQGKTMSDWMSSPSRAQNKGPLINNALGQL